MALSYEVLNLHHFMGTTAWEPKATVVSYALDEEHGIYRIQFEDSKRKLSLPPSYTYNKQRIKLLTNPNLPYRKDALKHVKITHEARELQNIAAIYEFLDGKTAYWHIECKNGFKVSACKDELKITDSILLRDANANSVFKYLKQAAKIIRSTSAQNSENNQIDPGQAPNNGEKDDFLAREYDKIKSIPSKTVAECYLSATQHVLKSGASAKAPIFPFGCNSSQFKAVKNALNNQMSVIEGPPGTGKTQTILNIIANLVIQGKTVQVVSNNNSAIDSIVEKLQKCELDFFVARLGNKYCKKHFIDKQTGRYPNFSAWASRLDIRETTHEVQQLAQKLQHIFEIQNTLAKRKHEFRSLQLEEQHFKRHFEGLGSGGFLYISSRNLTSDKLQTLMQKFEYLCESQTKPRLLDRLLFYVLYGVNLTALLQRDHLSMAYSIGRRFYRAKKDELEKEILALSECLAQHNAAQLIDNFTKLSLCLFRDHLKRRYVRGTQQRQRFTQKHLSGLSESKRFLTEYPVVLSTTYTARKSLAHDVLYDYIIMDESSQVDLVTGFLALSSAKNAVVVGDAQQLPNIIGQEKTALQHCFSHYTLNNAYDASRDKNSLLTSLCAVMGDRIPKVTLREHYRCHPQIIEFCNQKFYKGKLIVQSKPDDDGPAKNNGVALALYHTVKGNHARDNVNIRQIEVIKDEILPELYRQQCRPEDIGIIAPYRNQTARLTKELSNPRIEVDTVHKFQGREKQVIIYSTTDNQVKSFADTPEIINVAVSRAKKKLIVVAPSEEQPRNSIIADLINYMRYQNCKEVESAISSVFDNLYAQNKSSRKRRLALFHEKQQRISDYDSEELMREVIIHELQNRPQDNLDFRFEYPLYLLFKDTLKDARKSDALEPREKAFIRNSLSHVDFLIYKKSSSNKPILGIEVDGYSFHERSIKQTELDKIKNSIFEKCGLTLLRFSTKGSREEERLAKALDDLLEIRYPDTAKEQ